MNCHVCGSNMDSIVTDLPFKLNGATIVIFKNLPTYQCRNCTEYLLDDATLARLDEILETVDSAAELEVIKYAA